MAQQPLVAERVANAARAFAIELVGWRAHHRCASFDGALGSRVDVVQVQVDHARPVVAFSRRTDVALRKLVAQHQHGRAQLQLGMADAPAGLGEPEALGRTEGLLVEADRPLGVPVLEDKIVQRASAEVLNAIYEQDFLGFSYGFRPGKSAHNALDAVAVGVGIRRVSFILDADLSKFFDTIEHDWLVRFIEHRVADTRVVRQIKKWLHAGVLEDGRVTRSDVGTVQGGSLSPLLANIYLHYAFDLWAEQWRGRHARGEVIIVRYADDWLAGFQYRDDAVRFQRAVTERLGQFGLALHETKTRLIEFGRFAREDRRRRGQGKPQTFDFLGFTHCCGQTGKGKFMVLRLTSAKRMRAKLQALKLELRRRMHRPIPEQGEYLRAVVAGHARYFGVPDNGARLLTFRFQVARLWHRTLCRRSQTAHVSWKRMYRLIDHWLPRPHICHPYPNQRLIVTTRGKSRVR